MKKTFYMVLIILVIIIIYNLTNTAYEKVDESLIKQSYETDVGLVKPMFSNIQEIEATYWKAGEIVGTGRGNNIFNIGPSNLWWRGYILLPEDEGKEIFDKYEWVESFEFDEKGNPKDQFYSNYGENTSPEITGFTNFKWLYSQNFYEDNRPSHFLGALYFDEINNIIYFNLETN